MRLFDRVSRAEAEVDFVPCEQGAPCTHSNPCRIHVLYGFLGAAGFIAERTMLDDGPARGLGAYPHAPRCLWPSHPLGCKCNWEYLATLPLTVPPVEVEFAGHKRFPALPPIWAWRREPGETLWADTNSMVNRSRIEVEHGALWLLDTCAFCAVGNPRVRSSVTDCYVHTDTPVGRKVCTAWKVGGLDGTSWYLTGDPRQIPGHFRVRTMQLHGDCLHDPPQGFAVDHCFWCGGTGRVQSADLGFSTPERCTRCGGTGHLPDPPPSFPRECEFGRID